MKRAWLALAVLLLAGCSLPFGAGQTMQGAISETAYSISAYRTLTEPEIKATHQLPGATAVLATYQIERNGEHLLMVSPMLVERRGLGWDVQGGGGNWYPLNDPLPQFEASAGNSSGMNRKSYVDASGVVNDPTVGEVAIDLSDGTRAVVPVENGAFVWAQEGTMTVLSVEALDEHGTVLHRQTFDR